MLTSYKKTNYEAKLLTISILKDKINKNRFEKKIITKIKKQKNRKEKQNIVYYYCNP
jgi:hypothetical protein